jgi:hypothetical protein
MGFVQGLADTIPVKGKKARHGDKKDGPEDEAPGFAAAPLLLKGAGFF